MKDKLKGVVIAIAAVVVLGVGAAFAGAAGGDDDAGEKAITGQALDRAGAAALAETGGGRVTDTEVGDEESYYEVEVTQDGKETDVQLNRAFEVVGTEAEDGDEDEDEDSEN